MAFILNEFDVDSVQRSAAEDHHRPNLQRAVLTLARLVEWTNANSDGWPYWAKPSNASTKLQRLVYSRYLGRYDEREDGDLLPGELKQALSPIRAFLTRHGSGTSEVFPNG